MPIIAYQRAHGQNDLPLHFSFFSALAKRGVLDRYTFALDPLLDEDYCLQLVDRFPQLVLTTNVSSASRAMQFLKNRVGRGYRPLSYFGRFDGVCEGCGGHLHPDYMKDSVFRFYPRVSRRAILFQSVEGGVLESRQVRESIASVDLLITRTSASARRVANLGIKRVVESADIVFSQDPDFTRSKEGTAIALRVPNPPVEIEYLNSLKNVIELLAESNGVKDFVVIEEPLGEFLRAAVSRREDCAVYGGDEMYTPFSAKRDLVISARLHTTLIALLHGNRRIIQFQIEPRTNKVVEILSECGLTSLPVIGAAGMTPEFVTHCINSVRELPEHEISHALGVAQQRVSRGLDAFEEWLESL